MAATKINEQGWSKFLERVTRKFARVGPVLASSIRAKAPVRRGFRSFDTTPGPVGGTLRDGVTYAVIADGTVVESPASPNGGVIATPSEHGRKGAVVVVAGTTTAQAVGGDGYGLWVNSGTGRMAARPFVEEGFDEVSPQVPQIVAQP